MLIATRLHVHKFVTISQLSQVSGIQIEPDSLWRYF